MNHWLYKININFFELERVFIKCAVNASSLSSQSSAAALRLWVAEAVHGSLGSHQLPLDHGQRILRLRRLQLALSAYR